MTAAFAALLVLLAAALLAGCDEGPTILTQALCGGERTVAQCLHWDEQQAQVNLRLLFPGLHGRQWPTTPLGPSGAPIAVHVHDNELFQQLRDGVAACQQARGEPAWRLERMQIAQGGTIEMWLHAALAAYPRLVDDPAAADLVVPLLPATQWAQQITGTEYNCTGQQFDGFKGPRFVPYALKRWARDSALLEHKLLWLMPFYTMHKKLSYLTAPHHLLADLGPRPHENATTIYVPSTPLSDLVALVASCPCAYHQPKDRPFFFIAADRFGFFTDGRRVRALLKQVNWQQRYPGSLVDIVEHKFVMLDADDAQLLAARYAANIVRAKYCLIVAGDTLNVRRLWEAMVAGCVPVFLSQWRPPFAWLHNGTYWPRVSLTVRDYSSLPAVVAGLDAVYATPANVYAAIRQRLRSAVADVTWGFGDPQADTMLFGNAAAHMLEEAAMTFSHQSFVS